MFRLEFHYQVRLGEFKQFFALHQQLEEIALKKGLRPSTLWGATVGNLNKVVTFTDYDTISDFWEQTNAYQADSEYMNRWREMNKHVDGYPESELWESASQIA
jgi:hypothetical protein